MTRMISSLFTGFGVSDYRLHRHTNVFTYALRIYYPINEHDIIIIIISTDISFGNQFRHENIILTVRI